MLFRSTTRYYARENKSLISGDVSFRFQPFNGFQPDWLKFPALGTQSQPDVRAAQAPVTVGAADPSIREQEAVGWTSSNYATGFSSRWASFRAPVAGRYRVRFSGYTIWVGGNGASCGFCNAACAGVIWLVSAIRRWISSSLAFDAIAVGCNVGTSGTV